MAINELYESRFCRKTHTKIEKHSPRVLTLKSVSWIDLQANLIVTQSKVKLNWECHGLRLVSIKQKSHLQKPNTRAVKNTSLSEIFDPTLNPPAISPCQTI